ncbi:hypothetical protein SEVIR_6G069533v4 [Setaria viridis]|uniref:F-box domain-containing protein n=1 Tax=Setaria viridis TaxID=4556 RepID=A0A4U6U6T5_SETVI|nr:hypothetical protein SEVIR_6G069533v2 [Setaria viridis]
MEEYAAGKLRRLVHPRGVSDALGPSSSFHLEDLPEEIQLVVLSLLPLKEAARTSIISRNWRMLWTHFPNLCFDGANDQSTNDDSIKIESAVFIETVNSIIQQHGGIGLNKFSIRCSLRDNSSDHIDRWIRFATASKAKIIDMNLWPKRNNVGPTRNVYRFPLEALDAQDGPFIRSLFLTNVSIEPHLVICGFMRLKKLHLHCVHIIGDLPGLLLNCSSLEDLELITCSGVTDLNIPHQLDKLNHLLIRSNICVQMVEFHVPDLSHFEYQGDVIPIVLHGRPTLEEVTLKFHKALFDRDNNRALSHAITGIPSISTAKVLNVHTQMMEDRPV